MAHAGKCFKRGQWEAHLHDLLCQGIWAIFQSLSLSNVEHFIISWIHTDTLRISGLDTDTSNFAWIVHRFCLWRRILMGLSLVLSFLYAYFKLAGYSELDKALLKLCNKQIFHAFLFNIRNYSPEVINIQRRQTELNIILLRVNNFNIKQKKAWNIFFIICYQHQIRSGKIKANKTH